MKIIADWRPCCAGTKVKCSWAWFQKELEVYWSQNHHVIDKLIKSGASCLIIKLQGEMCFAPVNGLFSLKWDDSKKSTKRSRLHSFKHECCPTPTFSVVALKLYIKPWEAPLVTGVYAAPEGLSPVGYSNTSVIRTNSDTSELELRSATITWAWAVLVSAEQTCQTAFALNHLSVSRREKPKLSVSVKRRLHLIGYYLCSHFSCSFIRLMLRYMEWFLFIQVNRRTEIKT